MYPKPKLYSKLFKRFNLHAQRLRSSSYLNVQNSRATIRIQNSKKNVFNFKQNIQKFAHEKVTYPWLILRDRIMHRIYKALTLAAQICYQQHLITLINYQKQIVLNLI